MKTPNLLIKQLALNLISSFAEQSILLMFNDVFNFGSYANNQVLVSLLFAFSVFQFLSTQWVGINGLNKGLDNFSASNLIMSISSETVDYQIQQLFDSCQHPVFQIITTVAPVCATQIRKWVMLHQQTWKPYIRQASIFSLSMVGYWSKSLPGL